MVTMAISNIAWESHENEFIYKIMNSKGFNGLEVAPTKICASIAEITKEDSLAFRRDCNKWNIDIVAMQSLLFGRPDLLIFNECSRDGTLEYLKKCVDIGADLGAKALVFGSPKNRVIPNDDYEKYHEIAKNFFDTIGSYSADNGISFCIEPNPKEYGTNFICNTKDAIEFVKSINNDGLKVNIDTGTIIVNNEDYKDLLTESIDYIGHFHVSEPFLNPIDINRYMHKELSKILKNEGYKGAISIEMKCVSKESNMNTIYNALTGVSKIYS